MKLLLWADIHGWQKGTLENEFGICSSGVFQLPAKTQWQNAHVGTLLTQPCSHTICKGH